MVAFSLSQPAITGNFAWRTPMIGSIFATICVLGMVAVFFPTRCSRTFHLNRRGTGRGEIDNSQKEMITYPRRASFFRNLRIVHGHHPPCEGLSSHEFRIGDKTFCASCMGLFFGALVALTGTVAYFFNGWQIEQGALFAIGIGILGVLFGLLYIPVFDIKRSYLRLPLNAFFVLGTFFILIGFDALFHSVIMDLLLIGLIVFWLFTRISLSQWDHQTICRSCGLSCEFRKDNRSTYAHSAVVT